MNAQLVKRFRRELKANPRKAAVLAALLAVAGYYWVPLARSWMGGSQSQPTGSTVPAGSPAPVATAQAVAQPAQLSWQQMARLIDNTLRMLPEMDKRSPRDPFRSVVGDAAQQREQEKEQQAQAARPPLTPDSAGLKLQSTIVGPGKRLAVVGGQVREQGETIRVAKDDQQAAFVLAEVHARHVVLRRGRQEFQLKLAEPTLTASDVVRPEPKPAGK